MPTIPQGITSAFAVRCGHYGVVTPMAKDRDQSRPSLSREAERVDGTAARARIEELRRQLAGQHAQVQSLQGRLEQVVEITPVKRHALAAVAQADDVSRGEVAGRERQEDGQTVLFDVRRSLGTLLGVFQLTARIHWRTRVRDAPCPIPGEI